MEKEQWKEIEQHFHTALEYSPEEREKFLEALKKSHPKLFISVRQLLTSHFESNHFLENPIFDDMISNPDDRLGPWKIIREIGKGGMSTVFLAERADGSFTRQVAIKFLHGLAPGKEMHSRMKSEQKILASLNHKNICTLMDVGFHQNGRPYFIMEYIDGVPIDKWCSSHKLSIHERLYLFIQVCEAVSYAHQRLIVHRDIKPSNILVDKDGHVKLLDFGIAKIIRKVPDLSNTATDIYLMTPEYASPEQIHHQSITTATDIYALGQLLYLLLTDNLPFDFEKKSPFEISRIITETEPTKPSETVLISPVSLGELSDKQAAKQLRGDLDNIIIKTLQKNPQRRYQSAEHLKTDILNFIENKPVSARPETYTYRAKKFVQRHKTSVATALLTTILLIGSTIFSIWQAAEANSQRIIAEKRFVDVRNLANSLIFDLHDSIAPLPGSTPARELIMEEALNYLDQLAETEHADHALLLELATAYQKIGDVQGNPTNDNLGHHQESINSYQKGFSIAQSVIEQDSVNLRGREVLANISDKTGDVQAVLGNLETAKESKLASLNLYKSLADEYPEDQSRQFAYSISLIKSGDLMGNPNFSNLGDSKESLRLYKTAENLLLPIYNSEPETPNYIKYLGIVYERMGTIYQSENLLDEAIRSFDESMKLRQKLVETDPLNTDAIRDEAIAHEKMGDVFKHSDNLEKSLVSYQESFRLFSWLADTDPQNSMAKQSLAISYIHLGDLYYHPEQPSFDDKFQSRENFNHSKEILVDLKQTDSSNNRVDFLLGLIERRLQAM